MSDEKISLKEAIWRTGGGSGEFRYRLGVELGHIKPAPETNGHPCWCICEDCEAGARSGDTEGEQKECK